VAGRVAANATCVAKVHPTRAVAVADQALLPQCASSEVAVDWNAGRGGATKALAPLAEMRNKAVDNIIIIVNVFFDTSDLPPSPANSIMGPICRPHAVRHHSLRNSPVGNGIFTVRLPTVEKRQF
jgi:hypothetical protein